MCNVRFPDDSKLYDVDRQFMLGPAVVITPVLEQGATAVNGTFPKGRWYNIVQVSWFILKQNFLSDNKCGSHALSLQLHVNLHFFKPYASILDSDFHNRSIAQPTCIVANISQSPLYL